MSTRSKAPSNDAIERPGPSLPAQSDPGDEQHGLRPLQGVPPPMGEPIMTEQPNMLLCPAPVRRQRDPELVAMEQLTKVFNAMPEYCKQRVLSWLQAKYGCGPMGERPPQIVMSEARHP